MKFEDTRRAFDRFFNDYFENYDLKGFIVFIDKLEKPSKSVTKSTTKKKSKKR